MSNDWRPDWTNKSEYSSLDNASSQQWAWEFLRRNKSYADTITLINSGKLDSNDQEYFAAKYGFAWLPLPDPSAPTAPALGVYKGPYIVSGFVLNGDIRNLIGRDYEDIRLFDGSKLLAILDLDKGYGDQESVLKSTFRNERKLYKERGGSPKGGYHSFKFVHYLRILDAITIDHGITAQAIGNVLYPHKDEVGRKSSVEENIKSAKKLAEADYKLLF